MVGKPCILVLDGGSACDFMIIDEICERLSKQFRVVILSPVDRNSAIYSKVLRFVDDPCIIKEADRLGNAKANISTTLRAFIKCPRLVTTFLSLATSIRKALKEEEPVAVVSHYTYFHAGLTRSLPVPTVILHYAPAFPHKEHPHLFDPMMMRLSTTPNDDAPLDDSVANVESWLKVFQKTLPTFGPTSLKQSLYSRLKDVRFRRLGMTDLVEGVNKHLHLCCWPQGLIKSRITPLQGTSNVILRHGGWPIDIDSKGVKNMKVGKWIQGKSRICVFTLGSFAHAVAQHAIEQIAEHISKAGYDVLVLNIKKKDLRLPTGALHHNGYVNYNWLVPKVHLVVFTGSLCLQYICLYNKCPMVMVPQITEQYFWAKNYKKLTGKAYITVKAGEEIRGLEALRSSPAGERNLKVALSPSLSSTTYLICTTIAHIRGGRGSTAPQEDSAHRELLRKVAQYTKAFSAKMGGRRGRPLRGARQRQPRGPPASTRTRAA